MIQLTRLNLDQLVVNSDLIVLVEANPDTVLSLNNGEKLRVRESPAEVVDRVIAFRRLIGATEAVPDAITERH
jgi:flagellar protein FlbD